MPEQRLDDVRRRVVVEVLGGEDPTAVMRVQDQRAAVTATGTGRFGEAPQPGADVLGLDHRRVLGPLEQVGGAGQRPALVDIQVVARRHRGAVVEATDVRDDVRDHAPEAITDRDHASAVEL